jgi:GNAT superfamily N-acetyltransferase
MTASLRIVPLAPHHRPRWEILYAGYAEFYRVSQTPEMRARVWSWTQDPAHEVKGLIAEDAEGVAIGMAHYRPYARPLSASTGCFLDDLFVDPALRGQRVADALIDHLAAMARAVAARAAAMTPPVPPSSRRSAARRASTSSLLWTLPAGVSLNNPAYVTVTSLLDSSVTANSGTFYTRGIMC